MFKVTNTNDFDFTGRYNGMDYSFPKGTMVVCEDDPAKHIFGIGDADKTAVIARHGWSKPAQPTAEGLAILNRFQFDYIQPVYEAPHAASLSAHGPPPVVQDAPGAESSADDAPKAPGVVADGAAAAGAAVVKPGLTGTLTVPTFARDHQRGQQQHGRRP